MESNRNTSILVSGGEAYRGPQGAQGIPGPEGPRGPEGKQGPQGVPGKDGVNGKDGRDGVDGKDGKDGRGIKSIKLLDTKGKVKTYRIEFTDGSVFDFQVKDGEDGKGGVVAAGWKRGGQGVVVPSIVLSNNFPSASAEHIGKIYMYTGLTNDTYTHGYIYECVNKQTNAITFDPNTISCDGDDFMAFVKSISDDYENVVSGTMTYMYAGDIWVFVGKDAEGETVVTYQQYTGDFEAAGFTFTGTFEDEDVVSFTRETETYYEWERIDVQPGGSGGGAVNSVNGKTGTVVLNARDVGAATAAQGTKADSAVQPSDLGSAAYAETSDFATAAQGTLAGSALQPNDNITELNNDAGFITSSALNGYQLEANVQTLSATDSITLADNTIYNGGEQTALTIALPATTGVSFLCEICFSSGSTATTITYPQSGINWAGDDVSANVFTPVASKRYTIICSYDGSNYLFVVKGV